MLGAVDWAVFVAFLLLWLVCGAYQAYKTRKSNTARTVLLGDRKLAIFPTALALVATYMSAVSILGFPSEVYQFGLMIDWLAATYLIVFPVAAYGFLPVFFELKLTSAYEYLELRFNKTIRILVSSIYVVQVIIYLSVVLYAPALALSSVSQIGTPLAILLTGLVATFYTTLGGAAAVVWTSALQMLVIFGGLSAVVFGGAYQQSGFDAILTKNLEGGRFLWNDFRPDPRIRHSFWSLFVGGTFTLLTLFCANQMAVQRYLGMPTLKSAQICLLCNIPINCMLLLLYTFCAFVLYSVYAECDPVARGLIDKTDQLLPYFVSDRFSHVFGFSGLLVSAVYSAGLSTVSGGVNALSAVIFEDLLSFFYFKIWKRAISTISDKSKLRCVQLVSLLSGVALTACGLLLEYIAVPTVLQIAFSIFGMIGGPILATFLLGMFVPRANSKGALVGLLASTFVCFWMGIGKVVHSQPRPLPNSTFDVTYDCDVSLVGNDSTYKYNTTPVNLDDPSEKGLYDLSYQYYSLLAIFVTFLVALPISLLSAKPEPHNVQIKFFSPFIRRFLTPDKEKFDNENELFLNGNDEKEDLYMLKLN